MEADAIRKIQQLVLDAHPVIKAPDFETTGRYYTRDGNGDLMTEYANRDMLGERLASTRDLAQHARHRLKHQHAQKPYAAYISSAAIRLKYANTDLPDNGTAHDSIPLTMHPVFRELDELTAGSAFTQKELIIWLRATLNGHVPEALIQHFRSLTFSTEGEQANTVAVSGREHVSRKIAQRVAAEAGQDVIEEFEVNTPVYDLLELREVANAYQTVRILVDVSTDDNGRVIFTLTSVLDTIRAAVEETQTILRNTLLDELETAGVDVPLFLQP